MKQHGAAAAMVSVLVCFALFKHEHLLHYKRDLCGLRRTPIVYIPKSPSSLHPGLRHPQNIFHQGLFSLNCENNGAFHKEPLTSAALLVPLWFLCELDWLPREHTLYFVRFLIKEAGTWFVKNWEEYVSVLTVP